MQYVGFEVAFFSCRHKTKRPESSRLGTLCGQRWIRTTEGVRQQIYSLPHLATLEFALIFFVSCCSFVQPLACGCRRCAAVLAYLPPVCSTCCYFILRENPTILMAVTAYSSPLFPSRPPERSSACSWLFVVRSPKITGTSPSAFSCDKPLETAWHI